MNVFRGKYLHHLFVIVALIVTVVIVTLSNVRADELDLDDINRQLSDLQNQLQLSINATTPLEAEVDKLQLQVNSIQSQIVAAEVELTTLEEGIDSREAELVSQYIILASRVRDYYKKSRLYSPLLVFISSQSASDLTRGLTYKAATADEDKNFIVAITVDILQLEEDKERIEVDAGRLASLQYKLDEQRAFFEGEIAGAKIWQIELSGKIATLSVKQQQLLAEKFGSAPVPLLAYTSIGGCSSDIGKNPGFSPRYGFFSYGVPNKTGLNQYGAKGRAESGQSYEQILNAYYANFQIVDYGTGFNIAVNGTNSYGQTFNNQTFNIEEYLKYLYEMPHTWDSKALQAQAIAARTYALAATNDGQNSIKPNEYGQVVKFEENDSRWKDAVKATEGKVMVQTGTNTPISAWYSSTHGGVVLSSGQIGWNDKPWTKQAIDTPSGSAGSFSDLRSNAYDKQSPWFFCDWGYRSEYKNTAWLREDEVVDIVNAYILWKIDNNTISHLSQTDGNLSDTWSSDKVRQQIIDWNGSPISSISSVSVSWNGSGISQTININGVGYDAQKFKNLFNIRAPANIQIKPACRPDASLNCSKMYALFDVVRE